MGLRHIGLKCAVVLAVLASLSAQAAPAVEPVKVNLQAYKVVMLNGKESLTEAKSVKPGEVLEYRAVYSNTGKKNIVNLLAALPVPQGMEYIAQSGRPVVPEASLDGKLYAPVPLMRKRADGKADEPVPVAEYRALRWKAAELPAGKTFEVSARMRVGASQ